MNFLTHRGGRKSSGLNPGLAEASEQRTHAFGLAGLNLDRQAIFGIDAGPSQLEFSIRENLFQCGCQRRQQFFKGLFGVWPQQPVVCHDLKFPRAETKMARKGRIGLEKTAGQ